MNIFRHIMARGSWFSESWITSMAGYCASFLFRSCCYLNRGSHQSSWPGHSPSQQSGCSIGQYADSRSTTIVAIPRRGVIVPFQRPLVIGEHACLLLEAQ
ncbi:hypothetical protein COCSUDRAFT_54185 [Coccomyxa subellipsoidea C-169]|uniref:Uncharacterized protein n=1 Tax=Coccomyxa subellipsoidea (strain C-169) TaxID=574566 RepID=I0YQG4_COCSC|nr:hypothetical protein COCSUDRAFT_54185 [Coccomyxa subellipsoidea C-169]EIE20633.1 hypothetical protein COCSUDRAFT_54185 [Coccomyxa subellipsoidea C-169]|eukprot:XP_005645177.1 hypothetical protein COCSUDRAFT_54185 [Coccomyxa subellipsoidea C-169]